MKEQQRKCDMLVDIHSSFPIWSQFISDTASSVHMFLSLILPQLLGTC